MKPTATGCSPNTFSTLATLMDLPDATSSVVPARFTASTTSWRNSITRCAHGVVPRQRIFAFISQILERFRRPGQK